MKPVSLRQHRGNYSPEKRRQKAIAGAAKSKILNDFKPVTLAEVKSLTLEEIEKKYGK